MWRAIFIIGYVALAVSALPQIEPRHYRAIRLSFALEPEDGSLLERTLLDVSHPESGSYGKHLSREEAKSLLRPSEHTSQLVRKWLEDSSAKQVEEDGQWIHATWSEGDAERLNLRDMASKHAGLELPPHVARHVPLVVPQLSKVPSAAGGQTTRSSATLKKTRRSSSEANKSRQPSDDRGIVIPDGCASKMTPACLQALYHIDSNYQTPHPKSLLGIAGFDHQAAQHKELAQFLQQYAPFAAGADFSTALVNHGTNPQDESAMTGEVNFDIQYAVAIGYPVPVRFYSVGGEDHHFVPDLDLNDTKAEYIEPLLPLAQYLLNLPDSSLPQTVSISFGVNEQLVPIHYSQQVCNMFGQLGTRGVSIITGSGDGGPGASCQSNGASGKTKTGQPRFLPFWPASCPYVTAVGATQIVDNPASASASAAEDAAASESGCLSEGSEGADIVGDWEEQGVDFSGGGFSDFFPRPSWQKGFVDDYIHGLGNAFKGLYNRQGRGFPDVAVNGWEEQYYNHEVVDSFDGTSASSPIFAGMIARLNDQRLRSGKAALGFLNPWIYSIGRKGFTDITKGSSVGCQGESYSGGPSPVIPGAGWNATKGWDAITGIGTPDFQRLKELV